MAQIIEDASDGLPNIEKIMSEYPSHRWIFLTLTVKNPHVTDLRSTIQEMNTGWKRLTQSKRFSNVVDGFIRTTEVTRPKKGAGNGCSSSLSCDVACKVHVFQRYKLHQTIRMGRNVGQSNAT
jgi:hypothetical protein